MSTPLVGILIGSRADLTVMEGASTQLEELGIAHTLDVVSVHADPDGVREVATGAESAGYRVLIAGAARAAHLPGLVAAYTPLPVIGVPCFTEHLAGADALYSVVQMPTGVPVATVGIDGARNAAILAAQILAVAGADIAAKVRELRAEGRDEDRDHREISPGEAGSGTGFGFQARR